MSPLSNEPLVQILRPFGMGPRVGEYVEVPASAIGVVVSRNGDALDRMAPGAIPINPQYLPNTFQYLRVNPAAGTLIDCAVLAVFPTGSRTLHWDSEYLLSNEEYPGINIGRMSGLAQVRVTEPGAFIGGLLAYCKEIAQQGQEHQTFKLSLGTGKQWATAAVAALPEQAERLIEAAIGDFVIGAAGEALSTPTEPSAAKLKVQYQSQAPIEAWMQQAGMKLEGFSVEDMPSPDRAPCRGCQSFAAPTAHVKFHRNISLFYVRYHTSEDGNFCLPCGIKTGFRDNAIMLVCGWWGIIGAIVTPFLMLANLYSMIRLGIGPRRASVPADAPTGQATYLGPAS